MALTYKIPYYTLLTAAAAGVRAIRAMRAREIEIAPLQEFFAGHGAEHKEAV
jgi:carbamoyl-phosphate synthase large subunit